MTPTAVLVLVAGVLVVLFVAGAALALDTRHRRAGSRPTPPAPSGAEAPAVHERQVDVIDSARAEVDPPTVTIGRDPDDGPTVATSRPDDRDEPEPPRRG